MSSYLREGARDIEASSVGLQGALFGYTGALCISDTIVFTGGGLSNWRRGFSDC